MGIFGFGKSYSRDDLQRELKKLESLYRQSMTGGVDKSQLIQQFHEVMKICQKGNFNGSEMVEWLGTYTSLRNVTPAVQVFIEMM